MEKARIIFLGSGGGRKVTTSQARATGGFVIQAGSEQIHVDPGPGAVVRAAQFGVDTRNTSIVLVSHFHVDHSNDINVLANIITFGGKEKKGVFITGEFDDNCNLADYHLKSIERHVKIKPGDKAEVRKIIIKATQTKGHKVKTMGFKIFTPDFVIGYTSDTDFFPELIKEFKGCDIMIVNTLKPKNMKLKGHMNSDDAAKLLKGVKPKLGILQHFGVSMLKANPVYEARDIQKESGVQTIAANDGLVIDPISYSAKLKQKTMNLY